MNAQTQTDAERALEVDPGRDRELPLTAHLTELRDRIIKSAIAVAVMTVVGWVAFPPVFDLLVQPYCTLDTANATAAGECALIATRPLEAFSVRIKVALTVGLVAGLPLVAWQIWAFVAPGLHRTERRWTALFALLTFTMFVGGVAFAWWLLPRALDVLTAVAGDQVQPLLRAQEYVSFTLRMGFAFGLVFEIPVVLVALSLAGIVSRETLSRARPYALVGNTIIAGFVTPTTDAVTLLVMAVPMAVLYEVAVGCAWLVERRRRR